MACGDDDRRQAGPTDESEQCRKEHAAHALPEPDVAREWIVLADFVT